MFSKRIEFNKGDIVQYVAKEDRKLGIVLSEPYLSNDGWKVKTYCDGQVIKNPVETVKRVGEDVEIIQTKNYRY
jgi:hypothetical protein